MKSALLLLAILTSPLSSTEIRLTDDAPKPQDFKEMGVRAFYFFDGPTIAVFRDRIAFLKLPPTTHLGTTGLTDGTNSVDLLAFKPLRIMRFAVPFEVLVRSNALICTHPIYPHLSAHGYSDFCGIVAPDGKVLFRYPFQQHMPEDMLQIIGLSDDGKYAEVFLGRFVATLTDRKFQVTQPRQIVAWWYPDNYDVYDGPWSAGEPRDPKNAMGAMYRAFGKRESPRP